MSADLPLSARLCWWGTAWLRGAVAPDDLLDEVAGAGPLLPTLAGLRRAGCQGLALALPVEGDPLGLGGPPGFTTRAMAAGEAVLALGQDTGLVAEGDPVQWVSAPARRGIAPDLPEADRGLRGAVLEAAQRLSELDVARWRPEVADALMNLRRRPHCDHPPGVPPEAVNLAARALQAAGIVDLALADDGAAVSASEIDDRRGALVALDRAARRALVAACSPDGWPPAR